MAFGSTTPSQGITRNQEMPKKRHGFELNGLPPKKYMQNCTSLGLTAPSQDKSSEPKARTCYKLFEIGLPASI